MTIFRIALANLAYPVDPPDAVQRAEAAVALAAQEGAGLVCFPECYVPGYRGLGKLVPPVEEGFLEAAWATLAGAAARAGVGVILGTERREQDRLMATALVLRSDGTRAGFQDKVQLDPSEESVYSPGSSRRIFQEGPVTFGVVICHEGWRYPETVRWAARQGAQVVFHPHFHPGEPGRYQASTFADPANTFHEKAILCRAAENTCYFASVNCASAGSSTTSAVADPEGLLLTHQPYGVEGLLLADLDLDRATGLLARRLRDF